MARRALSAASSPSSSAATRELGKLAAPRLARVFSRERLFTRLDESVEQPMVWVASPPGSGKTTLIASYLAARKRSAFWVLLDRTDSDPATFFHFVTLALTAVKPRQRVQLSALPILTNEDLHDLPAFTRRYLRALAGALDAPWVIVLDNYQELAEDSPLHAALCEALSELPPRAQVIALSRTLPPATFARAVASQALSVLDAQAVRFTLDETRGLLDLHGRGDAAQSLQDAVDGWAAGLVLMLASEASAAVPLLPSTDRTPSRELVFDYFAGEVLARMTPAERGILERVALLPNPTEGMAIELAGDANAGRTLNALYRRNLFVDRRGTTTPSYVFHALFRDFLMARLREAVAPTELRALQLHAARLLAAAGQIDAAMEHLLNAEAWAEAESLLHAHAATYVAQERTPPLRAWVEALPESRRDQPMNAYWRAYCDLADDPSAAAIWFDRAYRGFVAQGDPVGQLLAAAGAADAIVLQRKGQAALDQWIAVFEALAPHYFEIHDPSTELRVLPGMLAAFVTRQAQHRLTAILFDRAERLMDQEPAATQRILFTAVASGLTDFGDPQRLGRLVAKLARLRDAPHIAPATVVRWRLLEAFWKFFVGRLDEALVDVTDAEHLSNAPGLERLRSTVHVTVAQVAWAAGDIARARTHLDLARPLLATGQLYERRYYEWIAGTVSIREGAPARAIEHLQRAVELSIEAGSPGLERVSNFQLGAVATQAGAYQIAEDALRNARAHPSYQASVFHQWVITTLEANLAEEMGDRARAVTLLRHGFGLARANGFLFAPGLFGYGIMPRLCAIALENGIEVELVRRMIKQFRLVAPDTASASWPWPVRIRTFGKFLIQRDDDGTSAGKKEQKKPLELLRLVIAQGGVGINAKRIAELLWPDAEGDAAQNSFDGALHRLRKLLGDDQSVRLQDGGLTIDAKICWVDVRALESLFEQSETLLAHEPTDLAIEALARRLVDLYAGPFLEGDDSYPPILAARERLRSRFLRQLSAMASHLEQHGHCDRAIALYQHALEQDVLAEELFRRVIRCHVQAGRRAEAYDAYRRCRDNLSIILGIKPSAETEALVRDLRG